MSFSKWAKLEPAELFSELGTSEQGLSQEEAKRRLIEHGPNSLPKAKGDSLAFIFLRQFASPLIYILLAAAFISFVSRAERDSIIILFVLILNAVIGTVQEGRAQRTLAALERFQEERATVVREGEETFVPSHELVVGDVIKVREGERVPADARLVVAYNVRVDEAALTGESKPVAKVDSAFPAVRDSALETKNIILSGSLIATGNGTAVVTATGVDTVMGGIGRAVLRLGREIPLARDIRGLSKVVLTAVLAMSAVLFVIGILSGESVVVMLATVVALSVSVIPEGLPIVLTLVLATGAWRMAKRNALVKKLQAVEALGQAQVIAVDKTGTLTRNEMVVEKLYTNGKEYVVSGEGYEPRGDLFEITADKGEELVVPADQPSVLLAGKVAALAATAHLAYDEAVNRWHVSGDPTEAALSVFSKKVGFSREELIQKHPLIQEIPFEYRTKEHTFVYASDEGRDLVVVGAPETVLARVTHEWREDAPVPLTDERHEETVHLFERFSREGLRVVAFAWKPKVNEFPLPLPEGSLPGLALVGLFGMRDDLRAGVREAIEKAQRAGIRVVMITGDHALTAHVIANEAGIAASENEVMTGKELATLDDKELARQLGHLSVFARVTPLEKLRIIKAYQDQGKVIAMTGDGVNDAPSLVAADLGIAMGGIGTEVAKEAADIVLLDDRFESIVAAIEEGRSMYRTIKKVILYLFSTSIGEALTIIGAILIGLPLPLLAVQILWLNLITDGFLDVALAMEPKESNLLTGEFRRSRTLVDRLMVIRMIVMGIPMMVGTLFLFSGTLDGFMPRAWSIALTTLAVFQW
ncbi:MAG: cation-translocating P-type ATPase, partial [Parcubacteria group bacterium]|nr:cation-translocating P-type ATPase [Parcubacteria group bacterium]